MKDCKLLYGVNVSLIAQQIYNKLIKCTVEIFCGVVCGDFMVVCGGLWYFNGPLLR